MEETQKRTDVRPTISLAPEIWEIAVTQMRRKGFNNNISQYIRDLIWRDKEETENRAMALRETPTRYRASASKAGNRRKTEAAALRDLKRRRATGDAPKDK